MLLSIMIRIMEVVGIHKVGEDWLIQLILVLTSNPKEYNVSVGKLHLIYIYIYQTRKTWKMGYKKQQNSCLYKLWCPFGLLNGWHFKNTFLKILSKWKLTWLENSTLHCIKLMACWQKFVSSIIHSSESVWTPPLRYCVNLNNYQRFCLITGIHS